MTNYLVNPAVRIDAEVEEGAVRFAIEAPIRGQGLCRTTVSGANTDLLESLLRLTQDRAADLSRLSSEDLSRLAEIGVLVRETETVWPIELDLTAGDIIVGPAEIDLERGLDDLIDIPLVTAKGARIAWIRDPMRNAWFPRLLAPEQLAALRPATGGGSEARADDVDPAVLSRRGSLELSVDAATLPAIWKRALAAAQYELDRLGYAVVPGLLPPDLVGAAGRYFDRCMTEGLLTADTAFANRFYAHRDALAEWLHKRVSDVLAPMLGDRYQRSYSFVSAYAGGAELPRHSDRAQCEITVSLCVRASAGAERWPLCLESAQEDAVVELRLGIGQAIIFKGRVLPHFRRPLGEGERYISLLFHYVEPGFTGSRD